MASEKELRVKFSAPLNDKDTETQTFGCRANNPDICGNAYLEGVCAFVTHDGICRKPSAAWKRQFNKLQEARKND
jgi:hypothetical protein